MWNINGISGMSDIDNICTIPRLPALIHPLKHPSASYSIHPVPYMCHAHGRSHFKITHFTCCARAADWETGTR